MKIFTDQIPTNYLSDNKIVLDIETTGVHRFNCHIQVVGLLSNNSKSFIQLVASDAQNEKDLLLALKDELSNKDIISYNGKNFDLPFIQARMKIHGIELPKINSHFDIYNYLIENRFFFSTESYALQAMEANLHFPRKENFEEVKDQVFYEDLSDSKLAHICLHNKYDVINTEKLLSFTKQLRDKRSFDFTYKNQSISAYIEAININNNICKVRLSVSESADIILVNGLESLRWNSSKIAMAFPIIEGYVAKKQLAHVYIQRQDPKIQDSSPYPLPTNILVIAHNRRIELTNIVNLCKLLLRKMLL